MTAVCYFDAGRENAPGCGMFYNEARVKETFIDELRFSTRRLIRTYWGAHREATLYSSTHHATNLVRLQEGSESLTSSMREENRS